MKTGLFNKKCMWTQVPKFNLTMLLKFKDRKTVKCHSSVITLDILNGIMTKANVLFKSVAMFNCRTLLMIFDSGHLLQEMLQ